MNTSSSILSPIAHSVTPIDWTVAQTMDIRRHPGRGGGPSGVDARLARTRILRKRPTSNPLMNGLVTPGSICVVDSQKTTDQ